MESAYYPWLRRLKEAGAYRGQAEAVLAGLPPSGQRLFIAALPQAVLANPDGPLAVVGHADLAWTYGFQDIKPTGVQRRAERFERVFRQMIKGGRVGVANHALAQSFTATAVELSVLDNQLARARARGTTLPEDVARTRRRAHLVDAAAGSCGVHPARRPRRTPVRAHATWRRAALAERRRWGRGGRAGGSGA